MPAGLDEGEGPGGPRDGSDFQNVHRNKRGITLNLKSPDGVAILKKLAAKADVLVENYRPDVKDRLGIGYAVMAAVNPRLIYGSISGYGEDGPYRMRPGFDQIAQGMGGLMSITGLPGQGPVRVGIPIADLCAGIFCAHGIAVALIEREKSEGPVGEVVAPAGAALHARLPGGALADEGRGGEAGGQQPSDLDPDRRLQDARRLHEPRGDRHQDLEPHVRGDRRGRSSPSTPTIRHRRAALQEPRQAARRARPGTSEKRDTADWIEILNKAGVPCRPIYSIDQAFADPQVKSLGMVQKVGEVPTSASR